MPKRIAENRTTLSAFHANSTGVRIFLCGLLTTSLISILIGVLILFMAGVCHAESVTIGAGGGMLLYRDDGRITFWNGRASYNYRDVFENEFGIARINSGMPWLSTEISTVGYSAELAVGGIKPKIAAGLVTSSDIEVLFGRARLQNNGAYGFYVAPSLNFSIREIDVTPSFLFGKVAFGTGNLYSFYGKPDIPALIRLGLSAEYEKTNTVGVTYGNMGLNILNNGNLPLFRSDNFCLGINHKYSFASARGQSGFYVASGISYARFYIDGALTAANQQYFLFPYVFYNLTGDANAPIGWIMTSVSLRRRHLNHIFKAGAGNIFGGELHANVHYKYRKFYGDEEVAKDIETIRLAGTGIVFSAYSLEYAGLPIADNVRVYGVVRKILGYYWGMDKFIADIPETEERVPESIGSIMRTILFSGLSGELKITF